MPAKTLLLPSVAAIALAVGATFPAAGKPSIVHNQSSSRAVTVAAEPVLSDAASVGLVGDRGQVVEQVAGDDGYTWYYVSFRPGTEGWIRENSLPGTAVQSPTAGMGEVTHAAIQTSTYAVRVYSHHNQLYMDVFNRTTGAMVLRQVPAVARSLPVGIRYANVSKEVIYQMTLSPKGRPALAVRYGDHLMAQEYGF